MATVPIEDILLEPESFEEAVTSPQKQAWLTAMREEYKSLMQNDTWTLYELPPGRKTVKSK
jgi:hypothetical protein